MAHPTLTALKDQSEAFLNSGLPMAEAMARYDRRRRSPLSRMMRLGSQLMMLVMVTKMVLKASQALMDMKRTREASAQREERLDQDVEATMDASDPITKY